VIRASGRFSDDQLLTAAAERDAGFDVGMFAQQLAAASRLQAAQVARYGVTADQLEAVKSRCVEWATDLHNQASTEATRQPPANPQARPAQPSRDPDRGTEL